MIIYIVQKCHRHESSENIKAFSDYGEAILYIEKLKEKQEIEIRERYDKYIASKNKMNPRLDSFEYFHSLYEFVFNIEELDLT